MKINKLILLAIIILFLGNNNSFAENIEKTINNKKITTKGKISISLPLRVNYGITENFNSYLSLDLSRFQISQNSNFSITSNIGSSYYFYKNDNLFLFSGIELPILVLRPYLYMGLEYFLSEKVSISGDIGIILGFYSSLLPNYFQNGSNLKVSYFF
ncbi:MAG: hypothetical protein U0457_02280 [Candidatus Sericytochromatia bacterium]